MSDKKPGSLIKGAVEVDLVKGKVGVSGEVSKVEAIVQALRTPKAKIQHAMAERIATHVNSGKPLSDLTPFEQSLLVEANAETIKKAMNRRQVVERALAHDPGIAGLLAAPEAPKEAQLETPETREGADEQVRFWERFWADAETTSVEYVQEMYARILAGKAKSPKAFSLRALDVLRCLDSSTAKTFKLVAAFTLNTWSVADVFTLNRGYNNAHLNFLIDAGLVATSPGVARQGVAYSYGRWHIRVAVEEMPDLASMPVMLHNLTSAGHELLAMVEVSVSIEHALWVCESFTAFHNRCEVAESAEGPWAEWTDFFAGPLAARNKAKPPST